MNNSHHARCVVLVLVFLYSPFLVSGLFTSSRAQEPEPPASTMRGIQLYEQGDLQGAAKVLEEIVAKRSGDADAWYYLGLTRYRQGWIGAALSPFERVVELRPDSADARAKLSYALILANEAEKALAMAQSAIALGDQSAEPHYAIAEASLRTASSLKPEDTLRTRALERAIEDADIALKLNSNFSLALITRSFALSKLKRYSEAAASLERFLSISPEDLDAEMWREQLTALQASDENFTKTVTGNSEVLAPREVTTKTRVLSKPEPSYTETARQKGVVGTVVIRAVFSSDGEVKNLRVLQALPFGLTTAAMQAARRIKFTPAMKEDRPVSMYIQLEYNFNLY
jgi:TonB family protein